MREAEMGQIAALIERVLVAPGDAGVKAAVRGEVKKLAGRFPLYS
jgi:glycine/serine hydroxymethyltransferase